MTKKILLWILKASLSTCLPSQKQSKKIISRNRKLLGKITFSEASSSRGSEVFNVPHLVAKMVQNLVNLRDRFRLSLVNRQCRFDFIKIWQNLQFKSNYNLCPKTFEKVIFIKIISLSNF